MKSAWTMDGAVGDLPGAVEAFNHALPGWWFSVGICHVSADASCAPDRAGCDGELLNDKNFDDGFHADLLPPATMADALRKVTRMAVEARKSALEDTNRCVTCGKQKQHFCGMGACVDVCPACDWKAG